MTVNPFGDRFSISLPYLLLIAAMLFFGFSVSAGTPIFASDEYVYFISGKFSSDLQMIHQRDPLLQQLTNVLYFSIVRFFYNIFNEQFVIGYRLVHIVEYLTAAIVLFKTVSPTLGRNLSVLGVCAFLMLPSQIYIYSVMPEVELVLLSSILGYLMIRTYTSRPLLACVMAGCLVAVAILIKPHALAIMLAVIGAIGIYQFATVKSGFLRRSAFHVLIFMVFAYLTTVLVWGLVSGMWSFNPSNALGLSFYGQYIEPTTGQITFLKKVLIFALYFSIHALVICLVFAPVVFWTVTCTFRAVFRSRESLSYESQKLMLAIFALALIVVHVAMTAWFTAGAALLKESEALRLHGRYLGPAIVLLPGLYFYAVAQCSEKNRRLMIGISLSALVLSLIVVNGFFKIYPWDNPLLFAFFNSKNWYLWNYKSQFGYWGYVLYAGLLVGIVYCSIRTKFVSQGYAIFLFSILSFGLLQNYSWLVSHLSSNKDVSTKSRVLGQLISAGDYGDGVLISQERFGRESYALFNLGKAVRPLDRVPGSVISNHDIAGANWLVVDGDYDLQVKTTLIADLKPLRFYLIDSEGTLGAGEKISIDLQNAANRSVFHGFNDAEEWGVWTSDAQASIKLSKEVSGKIKVNLSGWTLKENTGEPVEIRIGGTTTSIKMSDVRQDYEFFVDVKEPAQHILVSSKPLKPLGSNRALGVALSSLSVEVISVH